MRKKNYCIGSKMLVDYLGSALRPFFTTALLADVILVIAALYVIGLIGSIYAEFVYPEELGSPTFLSFFSDIQTFVSLIYGGAFLSKLWNYKDPVTDYLQTIHLLDEWTDRIRDTGYEKALLLKDLLGADALRRVAYYSLLMIEHAYKINSPTSKFTVRDVVEVEVEEPPLDDHFEIINKMKNDSYKTLYALFETEGKIFTWICEPLDAFVNRINATHINVMAKEPNVIVNSIALLLAFYFLILSPIYAWASTNFYIAPIAYAAKIFAYLLPVFYSYFAGNPFDPYRPFLVCDHEELTKKLMRRIAIEKFSP